MGPRNQSTACGAGSQRLRRSPLEKGAQLPAPRRMPELAKRLCLDLLDPLTRDGEALAAFFVGVLAAVADAEPHLDDLLLARRQRFEDALGRFLEVEVDHRLGRRPPLPVFDEVAEMRIFLFTDRGLE